MNSNITIVTAFFDIGRGEWANQLFKRTADDYLDYFKNLATLDNEMIIYTSADYTDKILTLRSGRPTKIIELDFNKKFKYTIKKLTISFKVKSIKQKYLLKRELTQNTNLPHMFSLTI